MTDILNVKNGDDFDIVKIISDPGPKLNRPLQTIDKNEAFPRKYMKCGNVIYVANVLTFNSLAENGYASFDLAEYINGSVSKIEYNGTMFAVPSLSPLGGMSTSAVFDLHRGQKACQKKLTERGCEDVLIDNEISDVAADDRTLLVTTKMMSESTPSERKHKLMNYNSDFVSDIVHTKRIRNVAPGIVDYKVRLNVPGTFTWGVVEVLSATFFNDILIQLVRQKDGWDVMKPRRYSNCGFVIARDPDTAMGIALVDWPRGAVLYPPKVHYKEFEDVNRWAITQQLGNPLNDSIKIPGGEYSWQIKMFFGPIWFVQEQVNKIRFKPHGNDHEILFGEDKAKRVAYMKHLRKKKSHAYPYI